MRFPPDAAALLLQRRIIEAVFKSVCYKLQEWYHESPKFSGELGDLYSKTVKIYSPIEERALDDWIAQGNQSGDSQDLGRFLYLMPIEDAGVRIPILSFAHDQTNTAGQPSWRFRIGLLCVTEEGDAEAWMSNSQIPGHAIMPNPSAIGFRYESPEGDDTSKHGFFHVQPITSFRRPGKETKACDYLPCPRYLPTRQPAIPIDASNFTEMMLCLFVSLYGIDESRKFLTPIIREVLPDNVGLLKQQFAGTQEHTRLIE